MFLHMFIEFASFYKKFWPFFVAMENIHETLSWCKCGHCALSTKIVECFCCHEKAVEYDEYGLLLDQIEANGDECLTKHADFRDNMLSEGILKIVAIWKKIGL